MDDAAGLRCAGVRRDVRVLASSVSAGTWHLLGVLDACTWTLMASPVSGDFLRDQDDDLDETSQADVLRELQFLHR